MAVNVQIWIDEAVEYARECMQELPSTPRNIVTALREGHSRMTMFGSYAATVRAMETEDLKFCMDEVRRRWPHTDTR